MSAVSLSPFSTIQPSSIAIETRNNYPLRTSQEACPASSWRDSAAPFEKLMGNRRRVPRGGYLYRADDPLIHLHAIRAGQFKTNYTTVEGEEQITGFHMVGELLGLDAIHDGRHRCSAIALEDSEVCELPFEKLQEMLLTVPSLLQHFHQLLAREIRREQGVMLLLANKRADQRVAAFVANLSSRYGALGYSTTRFRIRMSREEIGCYLGVTNESISRALSNFRKRGMLKIDNRDLEILDAVALREVAAGVGISSS
jgi:CRP/FNR family transcriptional regulator